MSEPTDTSVADLGQGRFRLRSGDVEQLAWAAVSGSETWVWLNGRQYIVDDRAGEPAHGSRGDDRTLAAPMPATVRAVHVTAGQAITTGDVLILLEAMKMELVITAPRSGVVHAVRCAVGDIVQPGVPLVELEGA